MRTKRTLYALLGLLVWAIFLGSMFLASRAVSARVNRPVSALKLNVGPDNELRPGDSVFLKTNVGLRSVGEVSSVDPQGHQVTIAINAIDALQLNDSTTARCWQTPLTVEQAIDALLPTSIRQDIAERLARDWQKHHDRLGKEWGPLIGELATAYFATVGDDLEAAIKGQQPQLWAVMRTKVDDLLDDWPTIQREINPVLERHLNPVLGRLLNDAIATAPKINIAWDVARGRNTEAFERMLNWITTYLASMPESDMAEMGKAVARSWEAAAANPILSKRFATWGRSFAEDEDLGNILTAVYRKAIVENPQTERFLRTRLLESPEFHDRLYKLIEALGPTARDIAATVLFSSDGATRPEVAHLVRYVALRRRVSWVTLATSVADSKPLPAGATLNTVAPRSTP